MSRQMAIQGLMLCLAGWYSSNCHMCISTSQASLHSETFSDTQSFDCWHYGIIAQFLLAQQTLYYYFFAFSSIFSWCFKGLHIQSSHCFRGLQPPFLKTIWEMEWVGICGYRSGLRFKVWWLTFEKWGVCNDGAYLLHLKLIEPHLNRYFCTSNWHRDSCA